MRSEYNFMAPPAANRAAIFRLMSASRHSPCPCHGHRDASHAHFLNQLRRLATPLDNHQKEYAFEVITEHLFFQNMG